MIFRQRARSGRLLLLGSVLTLAAIMSGCSSSSPQQPAQTAGGGGTSAGSPKAGGTLVWGMESEADALDPHLGGGWVTWRVRRQIFEGLVNNDLTQDGAMTLTIIPQLAKSWEVSPDGLAYTFKLREGVKFQDGTPVDAEAIKFNWDRFFDRSAPHFEAKVATKTQLTGFLTRIETPDAMTVKFILKQPFSAFLAQMTGLQSPFIGSPASIKKWGQDVSEHPAGTGPFRQVTRERGQKIVLERNPDWWGEKPYPYLNQVIFRPLPEAASRVAALRTREADLIVVPPPDTIQQLKDAGFTVHQGPTSHVWYGTFIIRNAPFDNPKVRQAVNYAINREGIAKDLLRDSVIPAYSVAVPGMQAYDPNYKPYPYDPAKAKQLLAEAGFANGFSTVFATSVDGSGQLLPVPMMEWIQRDLKAVGINMTIQSYEWQTYLGMSNGPQALGHRKELGMSQNSYGYPDDYFVQQISHSRWITETTPRGWYKNPEVDKLYDQALIELDPAKRTALYRQAIKIMTEQDAPFLPVVHDLAPIVYDKKVKGFAHTSEESYDITRVWLDQ